VEDRLTGASLALKVPRPGVPAAESEERFAREYTILQHLRGGALPGPVALRRLPDGAPGILMEPILGTPLDAHEQPLPWNRETLAHLFHLAACLGWLHQLGWCHLDLKPANVVLERDSGHARLLDAGLMARVGEAVPPRGTPGYVAPEMARGQAWDERADLFSLGAVFYRLLAGRDPFPGGSPGEILARAVRGRVTRLELLREDLPPPLVALVGSLLEPDPERRPRGVSEVLETLTRVAELEGWPPVPPPRAPAAAGGDGPPIPRPELEPVLARMGSEETRPLGIVLLEAPMGTGRDAVARDLADRLAHRGMAAEHVALEELGIRSPGELERTLLRVLGSPEAVGTAGPGAVADALWEHPSQLVLDLGAEAPGWFGEWLRRLVLGLASAAARMPRTGPVPGLILLAGSGLQGLPDPPGLSPLRRALGPLPTEVLTPYAEERLRWLAPWRAAEGPSAAELADLSHGYPEILWALLRQVLTGAPMPEEPATLVENLVAEGIATLDEGDRAVLGLLELAGQPADPQTLGLAAGMPPAAVRESLERLRRRGLVRSTARGWSVTYPEVVRLRGPLAVSDLEAARRAWTRALGRRRHALGTEAHAAWARLLASSGSPAAPRALLGAALRLYREERVAEAADLLERAWRARGDRPAAPGEDARWRWVARLLGLLLLELNRVHQPLFGELVDEILPPKDPVGIALRMRRSLGGGDGEIFRGPGDPLRERLPAPLLAPWAVAHVLVVRETEGGERACAVAAQVVERLRGRGLQGLRAFVLSVWLQQALLSGREEAGLVLQRLEALASESPGLSARIESLLGSGLLRFHRGELQPAREAVQQAVAALRRAGRMRALSWALSLLGGIAFEMGRWEEALGANRELVAILELTRQWREALNARRNLVLIRTRQALYEAALEEAEGLRQRVEQEGSRIPPSDRVAFAAMIAAPYLPVGRTASARAILEALGPRAGESIERFDEVIFLAVRARCGSDHPGEGFREMDPSWSRRADERAAEGGFHEVAAEICFNVAWDALRVEDVATAQSWLARVPPHGEALHLKAWRLLVESALRGLEGSWNAPEGHELLRSAQELIQELQRMGLPELLWRMEYVVAHALLALGDRPAASETLRSAWQRVRRIVTAMREERHRQGYLRSPDPSRLVRLLRKLGWRDPLLQIGP
jgi:tetratricopeptide (TPR) repeat protein